MAKNVKQTARTQNLNTRRLAAKAKSTRSTHLLNEFSLAAGFGSEIVGLLGVGSYIGYRLDRVFDSTPWLLITGFCVGFVGVLYRAYWISQAVNRQARPKKGSGLEQN